MQSNECFMCGGNDFTITDGAFVCNECGIQSQTIREEQINFNENIITINHDDMEDRDHEIMAGSQLEKQKKLLSWECYNLILLGLTNEMIELGAKPNLKVIVLQLWVRYLQYIEAAFTSRKHNKLPKLNSTINDTDCEILYGVTNVKRKILGPKTGMKRKTKKKLRINKKKSISPHSSASSAVTTGQLRQRITRKLQKLDYSAKSNDSNNESVGLSSDVSLLQRSKKSSKVKIKLTKMTKKCLTSIPSKSDGLTYEESSMLLKKGKKSWNTFKKHIDDTKHVRIKKLISIIQLALLINDDDIYLSDMLRWMHEGHFHINQVNIFLPENVVHGINLPRMMHYPSRSMLNRELTMLLECFGTNELPKVDYKKLVFRFCDELQFPIDFTHFVCKLVSLSTPRLQFKFNKRIPDIDIEVRIMAYILFAAKFLFCLDDKTENLSSDFAEKVNQSNKTDKQLFSWNKYVQYIECRNSVTSNYIYSLYKTMYGNNLHNTELFINKWNITMPTWPAKNKLSQGFRDSTESLLKLLPNNGENRSYREIPASTKPLSTTLKWILEYYPMQLSSDAKKILENNFVQTDILYLTDEKIIHDLAEKCNISVEVKSSHPLHYVKEKEIIRSFPRSYTDKTLVYLTNQFKPTYKNKFNKTMNNSHEENPNTIFLGTGLNYWSIYLSSSVFNKYNATKINSIFKTRFPRSFQWFLKQCCRLLNCPLSEMYRELIVVEKNFKSLLSNHCEQDTESDCSNSSITS